jgi:hypothetical protein
MSEEMANWRSSDSRLTTVVVTGSALASFSVRVAAVTVTASSR